MELGELESYILIVLAVVEETGIPAIDGFICGVPFGVVDNFTLYKLPVPMDGRGFKWQLV